MKSLPALIGGILFLGSSLTLAQAGKSKDLISAYRSQLELCRELIYLNLNKGKFIPGEPIFFTAYLMDQQKGIPLETPTNLYVGLYDDQGKELQQSIWEVSNGVAYGSLHIDPDYPHGDYYLKADTKRVKNFAPGNRALVKIEILEYESHVDPGVNAGFNVQIAAEGNNFLSDLINTIGFQVSDIRGLAVKIGYGEVINSKGEVVLSNLKTNDYGMGRFDLFLKPGETYTCRFMTSDGQVLEKEIPAAKEQGIALNVTGNMDNRIVSIRANKLIYSSNRNAQYYLVLHRDGRIRNKAFNLNKERRSFSLPREDLQEGVNILSLLDKNWNVLSERVIYNPYPVSKPRLHTVIKNCGASKDSLCLEVRSEDQRSEPFTLSVSVLAEESIAFEEKQTNREALAISPYLDDPAIFYPSILELPENRSFVDMDLMMLMHGKSNFSWSNARQVTALAEVPVEKGFEISGKVKNKNLDKIESLIMYQDRIEGMRTVELDEQGNFSIPNASMRKGELIHFSLLDHKSRMKIPELEVSFSPIRTKDSLELDTIQSNLIEASPKDDPAPDLKLWMQDRQNRLLEEVTLNVKIDTVQPSRNENLIGGFWNAVKISEEDVIRRRTLSNYLRSIGFKVTRQPLTGWLFVRARLSVNPRIFPPTIFLNGFRLSGPLPDYQLHDIDEIYYEHAGLTRSNGGTIHIYLREDGIIGQKDRSNFTSVLAENGFDTAEEFMNLRNREEADAMFVKYGCIHWEPKAISNERGEATIQFAGMGQRRFRVFIEGVTVDGSMISEQLILEVGSETN